MLSAFRMLSVGGTQSAEFAEKITEDPVTNKTSQSTVTCAYRTHIAGFFRTVTFFWSRNLMNHSLTVMVSSLDGDMNYSCKIDLVKPWQLFSSTKGSRSFNVEGNQVEIYWDLRSAKPSGAGGCSPEPVSDYYVAVVSEEEVVLLLGDQKKKAYKRTKSRPGLIEANLCYKKEIVFGKRCFSTRARFEDRRKEHEIVVESSGGSGTAAKEPEMWISVDGIAVVQVKNLQWKFRGNQTVIVDKLPVQVCWDVYDWLFGGSKMGQGLFVFKPGAAATAAATADESSDAEDSGGGGGGGGGGCSPLSRYYSTLSRCGALHDFCLFLYAWKLD